MGVYLGLVLKASAVSVSGFCRSVQRSGDQLLRAVKIGSTESKSVDRGGQSIDWNSSFLFQIQEGTVDFTLKKVGSFAGKPTLSVPHCCLVS